MQKKTREPQYQPIIDYRNEGLNERFGLMSGQGWFDDPKRLVFTLARYKFVAKMLSGRGRVLEIGCADAFASRIVQQEVGQLTAVDFDPTFINDVRDRMNDKWSFECFEHDLLEGPVPGIFDGVFLLDVLEHIKPSDEHRFLSNACASLDRAGVMIIGMPSLESQPYASSISREGHVNCMSMPSFKKTMEQYFENVFMFSMNDEVVHTGFHKMAHYLIALCCTKKIAINK